LSLPGILCRGTIDYLVSKINDEPDHFKKAALALHLTTLHPFNDGQKPTGFQLADNILRMNGLRISATKDAVCSVLCRIAEYKCSVDEIEHWIRDNYREI